MDFVAISTAVVLLAILLAWYGTVECLYFKTINFTDAGALKVLRFAGRYNYAA
jgi:hypothetical protein